TARTSAAAKATAWRGLAFVRNGATAAGSTISIPKATGIARVAVHVCSEVISSSRAPQLAAATAAPQATKASQLRSATERSSSDVPSPTHAHPRPAATLVGRPPARPAIRRKYGAGAITNTDSATIHVPVVVKSPVSGGAAKPRIATAPTIAKAPPISR